MIEHIFFFGEDCRNSILLIENMLQELGAIRPKTQAEAQFRCRLIDMLELSEASLIDAHALLLDASMCHDADDLALFLSQVETEVEQP